MADYDAHNPSRTHGTAHPGERLEASEVPRAVGDGPSPVNAVPVPELGGLQRRPVITAVRWGAVLAGVAVGLSMQLALTLLGVATGLTTMNVRQGDAVGLGPLIWAGVSMLISAFVGGYVAARMSGLKRKADGVLHGAVSWAVTTILFAVLAVSIGGALVGGIFSNMTQLAQVQAQTAEGDGPLAAFMRDQLGKMDVITMARLQQYLQNGERDGAVQLLVASSALEPQRAAAVVDQALILSGTPEAASPQSRRNAQTAVHDAGVAAWVVFGAVALGLLSGIGGGRLGVAGARRIDWSVAPQG